MDALSEQEVRAVVRFAVACARPALPLFQADCPTDRRPQDALEAAQAFADGTRRTKGLRDAAWAAQRAAHVARDAGLPAAGEAARAALAAAGAAFLHPLAKATQVRHILGAAAHSARAHELHAGDDASVGAEYIRRAQALALPEVVDVLRRYPPAPSGGARVGELVRLLDAALRGTASRIIGFHQDEHGDWVADLECGHTQHVRHNPPWMTRPWVTTAAGRQGMLGATLSCHLCSADD